MINRVEIYVDTINSKTEINNKPKKMGSVIAQKQVWINWCQELQEREKEKTAEWRPVATQEKESIVI